jgi:hypothetical protein
VTLYVAMTALALMTGLWSPSGTRHCSLTNVAKAVAGNREYVAMGQTSVAMGVYQTVTRLPCVASLAKTQICRAVCSFVVQSLVGAAYVDTLLWINSSS